MESDSVLKTAWEGRLGRHGAQPVHCCEEFESREMDSGAPNPITACVDLLDAFRFSWAGCVPLCHGPGEFQVTVCGVTVCPFSRHKGNQRPKCLLNKAQIHLSRNCPFSNKTNLHLEVPGHWALLGIITSTRRFFKRLHSNAICPVCPTSTLVVLIRPGKSFQNARSRSPE